MSAFKSGFVSIIGKPNVGKSTLLNAIVGEKVSIVSSKPQTTRKRIRGIKTLENAQIVFVDTPGLHRPIHLLGKRMQQEALESLQGVDLIVLVTDHRGKTVAELKIIELLKGIDSPVFLVINKIDLIRKPLLLPIIDDYRKLYDFKEIIPLSSLKGIAVDELVACIINYLPEGPKYYEDDLITDQYERYMASEIIREKILHHTEQEVPHAVAIDIISWKEREDGLIEIHADIIVEREGQKGIIIGKQGSLLKKIGTEARLEIERLTGRRVYLDLWMKVRKDWRENENILKGLGY